MQFILIPIIFVAVAVSGLSIIRTKYDERVTLYASQKIANEIREMYIKTLFRYIMKILLILGSCTLLPKITNDIEIIRISICFSYWVIIIDSLIYIFSNKEAILKIPVLHLFTFAYFQLKLAVMSEYEKLNLIEKIAEKIGVATGTIPDKNKTVDVIFNIHKPTFFDCIVCLIIMFFIYQSIFIYFVSPYFVENTVKIENFSRVQAYIYPFLKTVDFTFGTKSITIIGIDDTKYYFSPNEYNDYCEEANQKYLGNDFKGAIELYSKLESSNCIANFNFKIFYNLGLANYKINNNELAENFFEKYLQNNPNSIDTCYYLGILSEKNGNNEKSLEYYKKAIKLLHNLNDSPKWKNQVNYFNCIILLNT